MLLLCKHLSNDIQWFAWVDGALYVKEGDKLQAKLGSPETIVGANSLINAYLAGRYDATSTNPKTGAPRA